jgi:hypothetical protein
VLLQRCAGLLLNLAALETLGLWLDERNYIHKGDGRIFPLKQMASRFVVSRGDLALLSSNFEF